MESLRQVWVQQYYAPAAGQVAWRAAADLPPALRLITSPHDAEARFGLKRTTAWTGDKVHGSEPCAPEALHLSTPVETTVAPVDDGTRLAPIQPALVERGLVPAQQVVDTASVDAETLGRVRRRLGWRWWGPSARIRVGKRRRWTG